MDWRTVALIVCELAAVAILIAAARSGSGRRNGLLLAGIAVAVVGLGFGASG